MPVPDETNNFATHGKAPIPSNANGSFVVPHDRDANPRHERPKLDSLPKNPAMAPQVAAAPTAGSALGISMPSPTATMASPQATPVAMTAPITQIIPQQPEMLQQQVAQQQFMQQQLAQQQQAQMQAQMQQAQMQQMPMQQQVMPQQQMMPQQPMQQMAMQQMAMPQQMPQQQMPMQQMPMQQQVMPQQQMMPQQPMQQQVVELPAGAQQISPNQIVMTPAQIAEMQAQIMARALLSSQNQIYHRQKQTYKRSEEEPTPEYSAEEEPEQKDIRDEAPPARDTMSNETHGERVIQPIHDVVREQQRDDMSRRMTELLGEEDDTERMAVNTKTAKEIKQGKIQVPNATQASEQIAMTPEQLQQMEAERAAQIRASQPTPNQLFPEYSLSGEIIEQPRPTLQTTQESIIAAHQANVVTGQIFTSDVDAPKSQRSTSEQENFVEQAYHATPQTSHDITSRMDAPQLHDQESTAQSMDPRLAAIQQQQLMLIERQKMLQKEQAEQEEEARRLKEEAEQIEREQEEERRKVAQQQAATTNNPRELNPNRRSIRVNADVVKKAALATILRKPTPPPVEEPPKPVDPIRPAYVAELEEQLANDMKKESDNEIAAKMAAELADDEITKNAQQLKSTTPEVTQEQVIEAMPEEVLKAIENVNPTNPNIASAAEELNAGQ